jgi:hypothetical protein
MRSGRHTGNALSTKHRPLIATVCTLRRNEHTGGEACTLKKKRHLARTAAAALGVVRPYQDRLAKRGHQFLADGGSLAPLGLGRLGRIVAAEAPEGLVVHSRTVDNLPRMEDGAHAAVEQVSAAAAADLSTCVARLAVHVERPRGPVHLAIL